MKHKHEEKVADIPFLVNDPISCHYAVAAHKEDFNPTYETDALSQHVNRVKFLGQPCHLMMQAGDAKVCSSISISCSFCRSTRYWSAML